MTGAKRQRSDGGAQHGGAALTPSDSRCGLWRAAGGRGGSTEVRKEDALRKQRRMRSGTRREMKTVWFGETAEVKAARLEVCWKKRFPDKLK